MHAKLTPAPRKSENGQANLFFLVGLTISLIAIMLLFTRIGNANNLRSDAQTAADAAALAAAGVARDTAAHSLAEDEIPYNRLYDPAKGRAAADHYAKTNGALVEAIRASDDSQGNLGNVVRVEINTNACQKELQEDRSQDWSDVSCDGNTGSEEDAEHTGNAASIAEVVLPECEYAIGDTNISGITCDGQRIQSFRHAQQLIDVRIADEEGRYIYKPLGDASSGPE